MQYVDASQFLGVGWGIGCDPGGVKVVPGRGVF
jgi:hypothetical protein